MVEDISAQVRLAVEITIAGALLCSIASLLTIGLSFLHYFETNLILSYQTVGSATLNNLASQKYVSSANLYKAVSSLNYAVDTVVLQNSSGTVLKTLTAEGSGDTAFEYLLENPSTKYNITVSKRNGVYSFVAKEVL